MAQRPMDPKIIELVTDAERKADAGRRGKSWRLRTNGELTGRTVQYLRDLDDWARKVRRDILVIEYHLKKLGVDEADIFGDPGDPPPPPDELD